MNDNVTVTIVIISFFLLIIISYCVISGSNQKDINECLDNPNHYTEIFEGGKHNCCFKEVYNNNGKYDVREVCYCVVNFWYKLRV